MRVRSLLVAVGVAGVALAGCGDDDGDASRGPTIAVTTSILGDVVANLVGEAAEVVVVMPPGTSPHDFQASAQQAAAIRDADVVVANGAGFEEGLLEVIESAADDGTPVHDAIDAVQPIGDDPHFFTDPSRMADAAAGILDALVEHVPALDTDEVRARAAAYVDELERLDAEIESLLAAVPDDRRVLVTNHEVFSYFAERYRFEVVGTVIPGTSTGEGSAAGDLADLVEVIRAAGVPAIFADTSSPADLARTLADDVGDVEVVELFSESLGDDGSGGETYLDMLRTNAERVADALG